MKVLIGLVVVWGGVMVVRMIRTAFRQLDDAHRITHPNEGVYCNRTVREMERESKVGSR